MNLTWSAAKQHLPSVPSSGAIKIQELNTSACSQAFLLCSLISFSTYFYAKPTVTLDNTRHENKLKICSSLVNIFCRVKQSVLTLSVNSESTPLSVVVEWENGKWTSNEVNVIKAHNDSDLLPTDIQWQFSNMQIQLFRSCLLDYEIHSENIVKMHRIYRHGYRNAIFERFYLHKPFLHERKWLWQLPHDIILLRLATTAIAFDFIHSWSS